MTLSTSTRDRAAVALLLLASVPLAVLARTIAYDDGWITYRYAWNLASGHGFVYNLGERFLGTSAPGYAVLLALIGLPRPDIIPDVSAVLCGLSLIATGLGLYAYGRSSDDWLGGLAAGLFFVTCPVAIEAFGGEMGPQTALVVWAFVAQSRRRWMLAVLLAVAATILRPDGLVPLGLIGLHQIWARRQIPWREIALSALLLGVWYGALWLYFGAPLPQTVGAKNAQRVSGIWRPLGTDLVGWFTSLTIWPTTLFGNRPAPGFTGLVVLAGLGLPALLWFRHWWLLLAWPVLYMVAYRQLHLPFYHWYAVPPLVAVVVAAAAGVAGLSLVVAWLVRTVRRPADAASAASSRSLVDAVAAAAIIAVIVLPMWRHSAATTRAYPLSVERAYESLGRWFAQHTPPAASIGYLEIGIMGYHARRTVIDPLGLVNPSVAPHVAQRDFLWAYREYRPDYIVYNPVFFPELLGIVRDQPWFKAEYQPVTRLDSGRGVEIPLTIYRRTSTTPAPASAQ